MPNDERDDSALLICELCGAAGDHRAVGDGYLCDECYDAVPTEPVEGNDG